MPHPVVHFEIGCKDKEKTSAFYRQVFGWAIEFGPMGMIDLHQRARTVLHLPKDFVIHSLRHTMLTRLGESGVDAFTIMRIAGHSSITVSQRYVHPSPEAVERAFEWLQLSWTYPRNEPKVLPPATVSATLGKAATVNH
jgi:integrase